MKTYQISDQHLWHLQSGRSAEMGTGAGSSAACQDKSECPSWQNTPRHDRYYRYPILAVPSQLSHDKLSIWKLNHEFVWIVLDHFQWRLPIVSSNRISFQWGLWPLSLCSIGLISLNNMVHIDNNKFNILTVYSLHVVLGQLQADYTIWPVYQDTPHMGKYNKSRDWSNFNNPSNKETFY